MSIFTTQGLLTLTLETGTDISTATVLRINYKKPGGASGYFTGTLVGTTQIRYQFTDTDLDRAGLWKFQAYVEIGGLNAFGDIVEYEVKKTL